MDRVEQAEALVSTQAPRDALTLLWDEFHVAKGAGDTARLKEIEKVAKKIRDHTLDDAVTAESARKLVGTISGGDDDALPTPPPQPQPDVPVEITPVSFGVVAVGALVMLVAVFLPRFESNTFFRVAQNTLIQGSGGWYFIGIAVWVSGSAWFAYNRHARSWQPSILGGVAVGLAIYYGTNKGSLTLCAVDPSSGLACSKASPGVGIYAAGVGGALALIGGFQMLTAKTARRGFVTEASEDGVATPPVAPPSASGDIAGRLKTLEALRADGLITDAEYQQRRGALLDDI